MVESTRIGSRCAAFGEQATRVGRVQSDARRSGRITTRVGTGVSAAARWGRQHGLAVWQQRASQRKARGSMESERSVISLASGSITDNSGTPRLSMIKNAIVPVYVDRSEGGEEGFDPMQLAHPRT